MGYSGLSSYQLSIWVRILYIFLIYFTLCIKCAKFAKVPRSVDYLAFGLIIE